MERQKEQKKITPGIELALLQVLAQVHPADRHSTLPLGSGLMKVRPITWVYTSG
jgi:hypothetical protein